MRSTSSKARCARLGKRLNSKHGSKPVKSGTDTFGDNIADELPLLALFSIHKRPQGEARHQLRRDGLAAVEAALAPTATAKDADAIIRRP